MAAAKRLDTSKATVQVYGAREHNLKNIDVQIPRDSLVVITGLSGSGKSSLAFDTIYAEGQRRYFETLSAYARQFLGNMERPNVDKITGLSPVIAIEQKTVSRNPRSTVGTITEIYDFLRLLFARASDAYSQITGEKMVRYTDEQIVELIKEKFDEKILFILAPIVKSRKGHYKELFEQLRKKGFLQARIDGEILELKPSMKLDRYKVHNIELVVDKIVVSQENTKRLIASAQMAMKHGKGTMMVVDMNDSENVRYYSRHLMCPTTGISYNEPAPHTFSFNSPQGACKNCSGLGEIIEVDMSKVIPDPKVSIRKGAIVPLGAAKATSIFNVIEAICSTYQCSLDTAVEDLPSEALHAILYGTGQAFKVKSQYGGFEYKVNFEGAVNYVTREHSETQSKKAQAWATQFLSRKTCPACNGTRLKEESLYFRINQTNIAQLAAMDIKSLSKWFENVESELSDKQKLIAHEIIKEIRVRIGFLLDVGLYYLSLNLSARTLSGGESQRIRLATQIGSQLVNVLYILDEPSIGLHQRDNLKLIKALQQLRDTGNSVIVVEHDREMILSADHVIDMGPRAGINGGQIIAEGSPKEILKSSSLTANYLNGSLKIEVPPKRKGNGEQIRLIGASGNNLKNITVSFPLGMFICVTGVSGSGKSTLINETLQPILSKHLYNSVKEPLPYKSVEGLQFIDKVVQVDQSPIGRTPRSNPATYTGVFAEIRALFAKAPQAMVRGYEQGRFSFNVKGGRCEDCSGAGLQTIEMNFLPNVHVVCNTCSGKRYNRETLEVKYNGKNISDVLDMTIDVAAEFFSAHPKILPHLTSLQQVGMGYIKLGQASTTLSGGESQRVKLAAELSKKDTGKTVYILDEPTTGLHFEDIKALLGVLSKLADRGNTIIVIEHNIDVIKVADWIIDIGYEGGAEGGEVVCSGKPVDIAKHKKSYTAKFLRNEIG
jgi:excinuclease ABC subunit A